MKKISYFSLQISLTLLMLSAVWTAPLQAQAQVEESTSISLTGTGITDGALISFDDPLNCTSPMPMDCGGRTVCEYRSYVALEIGPLTDPSIDYETGIYTLTVEVQYSYVSNSGDFVPMETNTLEIGFNKDGGTFVNKDRRLFYGGYGVNLQIISAVFRDPSGTELDDSEIPVEAELFLGSLIDRYLPINESENNSVITYSLESGGSYIKLDWTDIPQADYYDLEWAWVDDELVNPEINQLDFKYNSTRVNIDVESSEYLISNIYRKGKIIGRVRGIGRSDDCNEFARTPWDKGNVVNVSMLNATEYQALDGHREGFNWQHSRSYAEEGKHKDVITYFDGTMRSRQSVSKLESDNHAIVSESYYDHVGRATIQSLPVPYITSPTTYAQSIDYYDNFNTHDSIPYNRSHFEKDNADCIEPPDTMDASGSGQYYSDANTIIDGHQAYVPDALGFPFTQIIYTQDQTGRVRFEGGVGEDASNWQWT